MLDPDAHVLLTDALRPPPGFDVDHAVATTYTLNLTAMLVAPMTFALAEVDDAAAAEGADSFDAVRVLDAVERHISHTTVFVQSGGIHVPRNFSRIYTFLEDSVHEVEPPREKALFHPKVWAVRFVDEEGTHLHRLVIASRNLTLDSSWDTVLVLEEDPEGTIAAAPAADFVAALPALCLSSLPEKRASAVNDLAATMRYVRFAAPPPYSGGALLPLGVDGCDTWSFPSDSLRVFAISPFLTESQLEEVRGGASEATLLSRAESMNLLGQERLSAWNTMVLHQAVEQPESEPEAHDEPGDPSGGSIGVVTRLDGIHAKTVIIDRPGGRSLTVTGSANLTTAAWGGNVEFDAALHGPTQDCGVAAVLDVDGAVIGMRSLMQPFTPQTAEGENDSAIEVSYCIEEFHRELARLRPALHVTLQDDQERARAVLNVDLPRSDFVDHTRIWLASTPSETRPLRSGRPWEIAVLNVTPLLAVETTAGEGVARVTRRCVLKCRLTGDDVDRRRAALAAILSSRKSVLRYLALLLGIDGIAGGRSDAAPSTLDEMHSESIHLGEDSAARLPPTVLFEPLVRAAGSDPARLASVARQIDDLRRMPRAAEIIPAEFTEMWDVVMQVIGRGHRP
ncbi:phospholipase D family protein [Brevibacterium sp. CS2]|uniref:phospholipase D family protein n=1 Tax=Brevibacterium sp. CS2 TaxID=2575923 RepID=UPI0010C79060|nr:phospholipase D family protein [Brevibacterium sp. CS2]QCP04585.1 hypothetical protein FDF13_04190 [Brevibacterium sp. CS2]